MFHLPRSGSAASAISCPVTSLLEQMEDDLNPDSYCELVLGMSAKQKVYLLRSLWIVNGSKLAKMNKYIPYMSLP